MKVFYCPTCKLHQYQFYADVTLVLGFQKDYQCRDTFQCTAGDPPFAGRAISPEEFSNAVCMECGNKLELQTLDVCPHIWEVAWDDEAKRRCRLCWKEERGKVVF